MARQRKSVTLSSKLDSSSVHHQQGNGNSSSSQGSATPNRPQATSPTTITKRFRLTQWRILFGCCCLAIASYFGYLGYLETRVNTPFDDQKMVQRTGLDDPLRYWGSYRPQNYFGMKTRDPHSLVMGLMWYNPQQLRHGGGGIRHWCDSGDNLKKYGWVQHDGKTFGVQEIYDDAFLIETSFVKIPGGQFGGDWTARVSVKNLHPTQDELSLIWYTALDEKTVGWIKQAPRVSHTDLTGLRGETRGLGEFTLKLQAINGTVMQESFLSTVVPNVQMLRETVTTFLRLASNEHNTKKFIVLGGEFLTDSNGNRQEPNFVATQVTFKAPFTLDIAYHSSSDLTNIDGPPTGEDYTTLLNEKRKEFSSSFENKFHLTAKGYSKSDVIFAESALSNMVGGIGYFYGVSKVLSSHTKEPVPYWKASLYTAVPSRSFFPRGFLWDEGFHGLLISSWDVDIELDIMNHWFDLMNIEGWIPREQILGLEALAKVPEEFVTQRNSNANPPTFFLALKRILNRYPETLIVKGRLANLDRLYTRLQSWFTWFNSTQKGEVPGTYRWRGRDELTNRELNPKTLTSGLDDYPRASHPNDKERHVDLRCWIAFASGVMADLARFLDRDDSKFLETHLYLSDNSLLNELHLSPFSETYSDWGLHTDSVILKKPQSQNKKNSNPHAPPENLEKVRVALKTPEYRFVDSAFGYNSLFPFLLEILTPDSPYLAKIFKNIRDPNILWTDFGLRSLSKASPLYMKRNTEHDPPYWRGQIWINLNYLALKALYHYGSQPGPYQNDAKSLYVELRNNIVTNIIKQYQKSGYIWEQYNDSTGEGSGCRPFTGWSALVVLVMAEQY